MSRSKKQINYLEPQMQSKVLPGPEQIHISTLCLDENIIVNGYDDLQELTMYHVFEAGLRKGRNNACLGYRPTENDSYKWYTYNEINSYANEVGSGLVNVRIGNDESNIAKLGIYAQNSVEWDVTQLACHRYKCIPIPLYDTLGPSAIKFIINETQISCIVCDSEKKVENIIQILGDCPSLKVLIVISPLSQKTVLRLKDLDIFYVSFQELRRLGSVNLVKSNIPSPEDIALILFTSGTTGNPKGVILKHKTVASNISALILQLTRGGLGVNLNKDDVIISYLPQAHGFNQVVTGCAFLNAARVGYFRGDVKTLLDDIKELKPTIFPVVPRLLNRIYDRIWAGVAKSYVKKQLLQRAYAAKKQMMEKGKLSNNTIWDKLVFRKVQKLLGGRLKLMVTGAAPISAEVLTFVRCAVGSCLLEGYGQTETVAPSTLTLNGDYTAGHVGVPLPCCEIKLVDVEDMNYYAKDQKGEICFRGSHIFSGYWNAPEKTKEVLDEDGWVHSGDIGCWQTNGTLKIIDRKKHIFKLSQGEYIAPEKLENIYVQASLVAQIFVHGDSLETCIVAIVVPDEEMLTKFAADRNISGDFNALCSSPVVKTEIMRQFTYLAKSNNLNPLENLKDIFVSSELFSIENDLLTPTFKSKRPNLKKQYETQLGDLYTNLKKSNSYGSKL